MKQVIIVFDDRIKPNNEIASITGGKSFGDTIFKRKKLSEIMQEHVSKKMLVWKDKQPNFAYYEEQTVIGHIFSNFAIKDHHEFQIVMQKAPYVKEDYVVFCEGEPAMGIFSSMTSYMHFIENLSNDPQILSFRLKQLEELKADVFVNIGIQEEFLTFITSGFEARFFNALEGDEYTVTKKSTNKEKIKSEYNFYHLLPDSMKMWFVMPFDYTEDEKSASYTMERYHMTDIAVRYVHGAVTIEEFRSILDRLFQFLNTRVRKTVGIDEWKNTANHLYIEKVKKRIHELEQHKDFPKIEQMIITGTKYNGINDILEKYETTYQELTNEKTGPFELVIGHGDLCFSNILYQRDAGILRLIDPKGCQKEEDLYTNPYYDVAKLSHSICGNYDFFNSGLYEIKLTDHMMFELQIEHDNHEYVEVFKEYLSKNGYDYSMVRLYEASLFLSMLPLHMDREQKVFGFILNAINILEMENIR
ncbi:MAG: DUF1679 domain-containing protein [Lachnospiraceae bacterium]|nr:DUF1679 domain-containing protein [Lachnospiraceae bacterium]